MGEGKGVGNRFALRKEVRGKLGVFGCWVLARSAPGLPLFPRAGGARAEKSPMHLPPSSHRASASSPGAVKPHAAGHRLHAPVHVGACTTTRGRGKGARAPGRPGPSRAAGLPGLSHCRPSSPPRLASALPHPCWP